MIKTQRYKTVYLILLPIVLILGMLYLKFRGNPFMCLFNELTDLYCFGCGTGRAFKALLNFNFKEAFSQNIISVVLLPFIAYVLFVEYINILFKREVFKNIKVSKKIGFTIVFAYLIFVILRNIPIFPFDLLAPY